MMDITKNYVKMMLLIGSTFVLTQQSKLFNKLYVLKVEFSCTYRNVNARLLANANQKIESRN